MSKTFFIGDTHFNHTNIIRYCNRPFADVEEMNAALIANWNSVVSDNDLVIHVGDIGMGNKEVITNLVAQLKGRKWLIMGNHDRFKVKDYYDMGFEYVSEFPIIYKGMVIISHQPVAVTADMPYFNIYGHVHDNPMYETRTPKTWCVSVERINFTPAEFVVEDLEHFGDPYEMAQKKRKVELADKVITIGEFMDKDINIIISGGRVFVEAHDRDVTFRQEYSTSKTGLDEIIEKIEKLFSDYDHPFTRFFIDKFDKVKEKL